MYVLIFDVLSCDFPAMVQMLTANRLIDGTVVYWKGDGWVEAVADAERFVETAAAEAALAAAKVSVAANVVVNPYLFGVAPASRREIIRATGPSVRALTSPPGGGNADV